MMARLAVLALFLSVAPGALGAGTGGFTDNNDRGHQLAQRICADLDERPAEATAKTGVLIIRNDQDHSKVPVQFRTTTTSTNWSTTFETIGPDKVVLTVIHETGKPDQCELSRGSQRTPEPLSPRETMVPFAGSDFWIVDLSLEFFHWPEQRILKPYEMRRGRSCKVLESINPDPSPNAYSRVDSWIDNETLGIVQAEAYDARGKLLKEFYPKDFKKVNGQWEVGEMEMINDQTGSRSWIKFNLNRDR